MLVEVEWVCGLWARAGVAATAAFAVGLWLHKHICRHRREEGEYPLTVYADFIIVSGF